MTGRRPAEVPRVAPCYGSGTGVTCEHLGFCEKSGAVCAMHRAWVQGSAAWRSQPRVPVKPGERPTK